MKTFVTASISLLVIAFWAGYWTHDVLFTKSEPEYLTYETTAPDNGIAMSVTGGEPFQNIPLMFGRDGRTVVTVHDSGDITYETGATCEDALKIVDEGRMTRPDAPGCGCEDMLRILAKRPTRDCEEPVRL